MTTPDRYPLIQRWQTLAQRYSMQRRFQTGEYLYRQGDPSNFVLLVVHGLVKLTMISGEGHETLQSMHSIGEFVGLESLSPGLPRQASAVSTDVVECWYFSTSAMSQVLTEAPELYGDIVWELARANVKLANRLGFYAVPVPQRVARVLVELAEHFGTSHEDRITLPPLSQPEIASLAGTNLRTTERALRDFERAGLLIRRYRRIDIGNLSDLRRLAGTATLDVNLPPPADRAPVSAAAERRGALRARDQQARTASAGVTTSPGDPFVEFEGTRYELASTEQLTFGRSAECTICIDESGPSIPRRAGQVYRANNVWWVANTSSTRSLAVIDDLGFRSVLPPGRRIAVERRTRIAVTGTNGTHFLNLHIPSTQQNTEPPPNDDMPDNVVISQKDRLALTALFAGYLEDGSRYDPHPKSYEAAAARLGWTRTTLVKRVEYLRVRLAKAGVPNLQGWNSLVALAEYVLACGTIHKDDLVLLNRPSSQEGRPKTT